MTSCDPAVEELVADVRASFVDLVQDVDVEAVRAQEVRGAARRDDLEAKPRQVARDRHDARLVVIVDADERGAPDGRC